MSTSVFPTHAVVRSYVLLFLISGRQLRRRRRRDALQLPQCTVAVTLIRLYFREYRASVCAAAKNG